MRDCSLHPFYYTSPLFHLSTRNFSQPTRPQCVIFNTHTIHIFIRRYAPTLPSTPPSPPSPLALSSEESVNEYLPIPLHFIACPTTLTYTSIFLEKETQSTKNCTIFHHRLPCPGPLPLIPPFPNIRKTNRTTQPTRPAHLQPRHMAEQQKQQQQPQHE